MQSSSQPQSQPLSLELACSQLSELWSPRIVGQLRGTCSCSADTTQYIKVARVQGEFPWHAHDHEDEMFLVLRGQLTIGIEPSEISPSGTSVVVKPGEFFIVPRGVRHNTSAAEETWIVLIEPASTQHTGNEQTPLTRSIAEQLG